MVLLEAKNISKSFRVGFLKKKKVFENIDFHVNQGDFLSIIGKSGEGKTTLVKILAGITHWDKGTVYYKGKKLGLFKNSFRKNLSFVFQDYKLIPNLTVLENIALPMRIKNTPQWKKKVRETMEFVGISHISGSYPYQISGGESQRTSIARALCVEPEIIFADEPTGNLDQETEEEILKLFKKVNQEMKKTFIIVTHEPSMLQHSNRIYKVEGGKVFEIHS
ncbi:MAG: hypothetical protein A2Y41_03565 [Spirochaetes bacterium GWB1_36_13]|nr:MAG: hypothetical protein A2Y41_03565 [Spirochaetes bacterium GWB1_36_13]